MGELPNANNCIYITTLLKNIAGPIYHDSDSGKKIIHSSKHTM